MARYWLFKSEPDVYGIDNLAGEKKGWGRWDGIRNYQARNFLRDQVAEGDQVLIYHSQCKPTGIAGLARVVRAAYPDPAQFDPESDYYDPKATQEDPRWYAVDITHEGTFSRLLPLTELKQQEPLANMVLLKQGRLSIQPVTPDEWHYILQLAER